MPQYYKTIPSNLKTWALSQPLFFTASAPLKGSHINISPKGLPTSSLAIPTESTLLYLDSTGSGCETISHLYENGRVTIMFCSFDQSPRILRFFCRGRVVEHGTAEYNLLLPSLGIGEKSNGKGIPTARAIIYCDVFKVQSSCGYGVPLFLEGKWEDRDTLNNWGQKQVDNGKLGEYQVNNNVRSLDGLPGLRNARRMKGEWTRTVEGWVVLLRVWGYLACFLMGLLLGILIVGTTSSGLGEILWKLDGKGFAADW
ncbi:hypothetical protein TWF788_007196 [Orbilia oligospora]|uniref:Pyridoxamine 5'-phosphate oxidase putative domain-containing protein n=1 Tax=Orbilia oligospora TaxID=2813651 RepID=A0A6G1MPL6_ORBOL|nr:hypothetical protein TWF788_007196 [Orbilia oligospora]KAF3221596.1 hypothetical protein TWF191_007099 [Orbilia oligospora]KAF3264292.1 hypothetical protein TWF192_003980 [Orbilia oligospora]